MSAPLSLAHLPDTMLASHLELRALLTLARAGMILAPLRVLREDTEENFYRLNNLPAQLSTLFAPFDLSDPDEDDVEELVPEAQGLVRSHYLLDEVVDTFYSGLEGLPQELRVRRLNAPGSFFGGRLARRGRPALLALKELWAEDWSFTSVWGRLEREASVALSAQPLLLAPSGYSDAGDAEAERATTLLGEPVRLLHDPDFGLTGVRFVDRQS